LELSRRAVRSNSRVTGDSSKAGQVPAHRRQFEFRSLTIWLDLEEKSVQLVPEELSSELPLLIKCCQRNCSQVTVIKENKSRFQSESMFFIFIFYICM
jgi:hypothetical protein